MTERVMRFFSPIEVLFGTFTDGEYNGTSEEITAAEAVQYVEAIQAAIDADLARIGSDRYLAEYLDHDGAPPLQVEANRVVRSIVPSVEVRGGELWGVTTIRLVEEIEPEVLADVLEWLNNQYSDGWGDSFLQFPIFVENGAVQVDFWKPTRKVLLPYKHRFGVLTREVLDLELDESTG